MAEAEAEEESLRWEEVEPQTAILKTILKSILETVLKTILKLKVIIKGLEGGSGLAIRKGSNLVDQA